MVTTIRVLVKFDAEPSQIFLDNYSDRMINVIDDYCNNRPRSYHTEAPTEKQLARGDYNYRWIIDVCDASAHADELFNYINPIPGGKLLLVDVLDHRFDPAHKSNVGYYWTNEGTTMYHDSKRMYIDPVYEFHADGEQHYEIVHIPTYAERFCPRDKERYDKCGATFMWRCTGSWDNWMKATTIDEAIEEFEQMYKKMLWNSIESLQKRLNTATEAFSKFDEYRWNKKW